jgi:hypothetical protein
MLQSLTHGARSFAAASLLVAFIIALWFMARRR